MPGKRAWFPIPLSIRACGFPAHGLPMIFLARQRNQQEPDDNAPPEGSHPTGTDWHAAPETPAAWPLPIACLAAELHREGFDLVVLEAKLAGWR